MSGSSLVRLDAAELNDVLHSLYGRDLLVVLSLEPESFSMALQGPVLAVVGDGAGSRVTLELGRAQTLTIPVEGVLAFAGSSQRDGTEPVWVEIQAHGGPTLVIEEISHEIFAKCRFDGST